jgi:hypothetical protein
LELAALGFELLHLPMCLVALRFETFPLNTVTISGATKLFAVLGIYAVHISRFSYL